VSALHLNFVNNIYNCTFWNILVCTNSGEFLSVLARSMSLPHQSSWLDNTMMDEIIFCHQVTTTHIHWIWRVAVSSLVLAISYLTDCCLHSHVYSSDCRPSSILVFPYPLPTVLFFFNMHVCFCDCTKNLKPSECCTNSLPTKDKKWKGKCMHMQTPSYSLRLHHTTIYLTSHHQVHFFLLWIALALNCSPWGLYMWVHEGEYK
jgi:hypothetical protein